jgi:hypothetical protein
MSTLKIAPELTWFPESKTAVIDKVDYIEYGYLGIFVLAIVLFLYSFSKVKT